MYLCNRNSRVWPPDDKGETCPALSFFYLGQDLERVSYMKKKTLDDVLSLFYKTWGDRYDYKHITPELFNGASLEVPIVCKKHGVFWMKPSDHYRHHGCPSCDIERRKEPRFYERKLLFGVGVLDISYSIKIDSEHEDAYLDWYNMLKRCYSEDNLRLHPTYNNCSVCEEWKRFSNFKKWFDKNCIKDYCLDKDILVKGNKVYSPDTCCYVPQEINKILVNKRLSRGEYPIGVHKTTRNDKYTYFVARVYKYGKVVRLGYYHTPEEAFMAYKMAKESYIQEMATQYFNEGKITKKVYNALMNYKVEITD